MSDESQRDWLDAVLDQAKELLRTQCKDPTLIKKRQSRSTTRVVYTVEIW